MIVEGEQLALEVDDDLVLLGRVAAEVRRRHHLAEHTATAAGRAIKANAAAGAHRSEAVTALRELLAAMTDGAGHDGRVDLAEARAAARALLDDEGGKP